MPTSPEAIEKFLSYRVRTPLKAKGADPQFLLDTIYKVGNRYPTFKSVLRPTGLEGLAFALWAQRSLLYYDPRTGKTPIALNWIAYLRACNFIKRCLIVAHAPIGVDEWEGQTPEHSELYIRSIYSSPSAFDELCDALETDCDAIIMSRTTLQTLFSEKRKMKRKEKDKLYPDKEKLQAVAPFFDAIVIDEIHKSMNHDSLGFQIQSELISNCKWRLGLTGTPLGRDPYSLWAQAFLMDEGQALSSNFYFFKQVFSKSPKGEYNYFSKRWEHKFDPKKLPLLKQKIEHMVLTCALSEIQNTNVLSGVVHLKMSPRQQLAYSETINELIETQATDYAKKKNCFVKLRQIASGYLPMIDEDGKKQTVDFFDASKFIWLEDFISEADPNIKCVFIHEFIATGERICRILQRAKIKHAWLYGSTKDRGATYRQFKEDKSTQVLVANWGTGGTGINLAEADYLCFFESPVSPIARKQTEARPLARGERPLVMDDLVCAPVEERILGFIAEGKSIANNLFGDPKLLAKQLSL